MTRTATATAPIPDHYATLGLPRTASGQQIASRATHLIEAGRTARVDNAVRAFCSRTGHAAPGTLGDLAAVDSTAVSEAARVLTDPRSRTAYNAQLGRRGRAVALAG